MVLLQREARSTSFDRVSVFYGMAPGSKSPKTGIDLFKLPVIGTGRTWAPRKNVWFSFLLIFSDQS